MKNTMLILMTVLLIPFISFAEDDDDGCVAGDVKPEFSAKMDGVIKYRAKIVKKDNFISETFELEDGTLVQVTQGGCAHFGKAVKFTLDTTKTINKTKTKSKTKVKNKMTEKKFSMTAWLGRANELLGKLPKPNDIASSLQIELKEQKKSLLSQKPYQDKRHHSVESTDKNGYNTVSLDINEKSKTTDVTISVNTAL